MCARKAVKSRRNEISTLHQGDIKRKLQIILRTYGTRNSFRLYHGTDLYQFSFDLPSQVIIEILNDKLTTDAFPGAFRLIVPCKIIIVVRI